MKITSWTRRTCKKCRRERVHYTVEGSNQWQCIGTHPGSRGIVTPCGKRKRLL